MEVDQDDVVANMQSTSGEPPRARRTSSKLIQTKTYNIMYKIIHKLIDFPDAPLHLRPALPYSSKKQKSIGSETLSLPHI